jgi:hypothetical protein
MASIAVLNIGVMTLPPWFLGRCCFCVPLFLFQATVPSSFPRKQESYWVPACAG